MSTKVGAIITGGDFQALGASRTLARKGIPVILLDSDLCIGRFSRYTKKFFRSPSPAQVESYVEFLVKLAETNDVQGWVLIPNSDEAVFVLSKNKALLERYFRVPTPDWSVIQHLYIKKNTYQLAEKNGIPIPRTWYPQNLEELLALDIQLPAVIKPSVRDHFYRSTKKKAFLIKDREAMEQTYRYVCSFIDPSEVLVQDFIPGGPNNLYSCCPFFKDGRILTSVMARRARQHPMDFGHASTYAETVRVPEMQAMAEKLLRLVGYYGIAEVEFMRDPRDGKYKLIEVNPRIWGWHTLAIRAGVDFPYMLFQDMIGEKLQAPDPAEHVKWVRLITDIPTVLKEIIRGRMSIGDYLKSMRGPKEFAVLALDDPLPFVAEVLMALYLWIKRGF
jgi:D-aspartate ligase